MLKLTFSSLAFYASLAPAINFSQLYFIGDSLTDSGNHGVESNDSTWAKYLSNDYGYNLTPSNQGGTNYAAGGAVTGPEHTAPANDQATNNMDVQLGELLKKQPSLNPNALYTIWGGGNNFLGSLANPKNLDLPLGIKDLMSQANTLHNHGAKYIMLVNLPDISIAPAIQNNPALKPLSSIVSGLIERNNTLLRNAANEQPFDIIQLDDDHFLNEILKNPSRFGITNMTGEAQSDKPKDISRYFFWNSVHPTSTVHHALADFAYDTLIAPGQIAMLAEAPLYNTQVENSSVLNQMGTGIASNYYKATNDRPGRWQLFFTGQGTDNQNLDPNNNNNLSNFGFGIGAYEHMDKTKTVGVSYQFSRVNNEFATKRGHFNFYSNSFSGFGNIAYRKLNITGLVSAGILDFYDIKRNALFNHTMDVDNGQTTGSIFSGLLGTDYSWIQNNDYAVKPTASINYQLIDVQGFNEASPIESATRLNYKNQSNQALNGEVGFKANMMRRHLLNMQVLTQAKIVYRQVWLDNDRDVNFSTATIEGSHSHLPENTNPGSGVVTNLSVAGIMHNGSIINVGLDYQYKTDMPTFIASYTIPFE